MAWRLVRVVQPVGDKADAAEDSTSVRLRHARAAVNDPDVLLSQAAIEGITSRSNYAPPRGIISLTPHASVRGDNQLVSSTPAGVALHL